MQSFPQFALLAQHGSSSSQFREFERTAKPARSEAEPLCVLNKDLTKPCQSWMCKCKIHFH
jgi:hypothetical protein